MWNVLDHFGPSLRASTILSGQKFTSVTKVCGSTMLKRLNTSVYYKGGGGGVPIPESRHIFLTDPGCRLCFPQIPEPDITQIAESRKHFTPNLGMPEPTSAPPPPYDGIAMCLHKMCTRFFLPRISTKKFNMYMYMYMYILQYVYEHAPTCICTFSNMYMYIHSPICICTFSNMYMYILQYVYVHSPIYICTFSNMYMYILQYIYVHSPIHHIHHISYVTLYFGEVGHALSAPKVGRINLVCLFLKIKLFN